MQLSTFFRIAARAASAAPPVQVGQVLDEHQGSRICIRVGVRSGVAAVFAVFFVIAAAALALTNTRTVVAGDGRFEGQSSVTLIQEQEIPKILFLTGLKC
mgnify:CR=1 FL=1